MKSLGIKCVMYACTPEKKILVLHSDGESIAIGRNGERLDVGAFLGTLPKGQARRVRKALFSKGFRRIAGSVRVPQSHLLVDGGCCYIRPVLKAA